MDSDWDPLFYWVKTCSNLDGVKNEIICTIPENVFVWNYKDLCNGVLLNAVLIYIHERCAKIDAKSALTNDITSRLKNLATVMKNVHSYYSEVLNQFIVMPLPDLLTIARHPFPEGSGEEMKKVLLLLLGCAVQSDKKEEFINKIKELDLSLQQAIVEQIRKVTNDVDCVLNVQALELDPDDKNTTIVLHQLQRVIKERDCYAQTVLDLNQEQESDSSSTQSVCNGDVCSRKLPESQQHVQYSSDALRESSIEKHHSIVEVAELKSKYRRIKQEFEQVNDQVAFYKEDIDDKDATIGKLRQENLDLKRDALAAKSYRDEVDVLREKADKSDRLELECDKYKEKLAELEFFKQRVEEIRADNDNLSETNSMLNEQCESLRRRVQQNGDAETNLIQSQRNIFDLQQQLKIGLEKQHGLVEENHRLEKECQEILTKSVNLEKELDFLKTSNVRSPSSTVHVSLSDQLNDSTHSKILKLELENQKLRSQMDSNGDKTATMEVLEELQSENEKLKKKLEYVQDQNMKSSNLCLDLQDERETFVRQRQDFERTFGSLEDNFKREIDELKQENKNLIDDLSSAKAKSTENQVEEQKRRSEELEMKMENLKIERDELKSKKSTLSSENKSMAQEISRLKSELTRTQDRVLENEKEKLNYENRAYVFDREKRCMDKENLKMKQMLDASDVEVEKLKSRLSDLERDKEKFDIFQTKLSDAEQNLSELEIEKKHLAQQVDMEQKKMSALREDLVKEKTRVNEMEIKIQSISTCLNLPATSSDGDHLTKIDSAVQNFVKKLKCEVEEYQSKYQQTNFDRNQLLEQIQAKDKDMESLKTKLMTQQTTDSSKTLIKELEQKNMSMADENKNVKQQVYILQEQIRKMQSSIDGAGREKSLLQQEIKDLQLQMSSNSAAQSDNAKLQVELRALQLQVTVLEQDNIELEKQCGQLERDHGALRRDYEQMQSQHGSLLNDHEQLQILHEQLSQDFEKLQCELGTLKGQMRQIRHECLEHCEQLDRLNVEKKSFTDQKSKWDQERQTREREFKTFALLQNEHGTLKKSHEELKNRYDFLTGDMDNVRVEYRNLRTDYNNVTLRATQLQGQLTDCQELIQRKELEVLKLLHKCEMMAQLNGTLEEESRTLLRQMDVLISQNQDLLTQTLMDKEHYHCEEKELVQKMNDLRRNKEKLEEKIMEQYKGMESPNKRKEKTNFIKKARAALTPKPSTKKLKNRSNGELIEDNYVSADEGGFSPVTGRKISGYSTPIRAVSAERPNSLFLNNADLKSSNSTTSLETLQNAGMQSPPVSHKRSHSSSTQPESNLSSNGSSNGAQIETSAQQHLLVPSMSNGSVVIDRISLNGSERAVDVPIDKLSPNSMVSPGAKLPPPYPPPRQTGRINGPPPPPRIPTQPRTVPPRYGAPVGARLPPTSPTLSRSSSGVCRPRPPPPPYPRGSFHKPPPLPTSSPVSPQSSRALGRFRPDLAADDRDVKHQNCSQNNASEQYFAPQQTSTPTTEQRFIFSSPPPGVYHPGNNSVVVLPPDYESVPMIRKSSSNRNIHPQDLAIINKRKEVLSFYENIENLSCAANLNLDTRELDPTLGSDVIPDSTNGGRDNSIWYEYGCV